MNRRERGTHGPEAAKTSHCTPMQVGCGGSPGQCSTLRDVRCGLIGLRVARHLHRFAMHLFALHHLRAPRSRLPTAVQPCRYATALIREMSDCRASEKGTEGPQPFVAKPPKNCGTGRVWLAGRITRGGVSLDLLRPTQKNALPGDFLWFFYFDAKNPIKP